MTLTPTQAWQQLRDGNTRFTNGEMNHPSQDIHRRNELSQSQHPFAVLFGCSDSRVAAEIIFDQGLGDLFVVRTAGHVLDTTVIGSIEYGVDLLDVPLVVVLGHDHCGAVHAAVQALSTGSYPNGFVRAVVDRVIPSVARMTSGENPGVVEMDEDRLRRDHVRHTVEMLEAYSAGLRSAIAAGRCAIVGVEYSLDDGRARLVDVAGDIGEEPEVS